MSRDVLTTLFLNQKGHQTMQILTATQKVDLAITVVDAKGNPAAIDGTPVWTVSDPAILSINSDTGDGMGATVTAVGPVGTAQVNVEVDADTGDGVRPLVGVLDVQVVAGEAMAVNIAPGTPTEQ